MQKILAPVGEAHVARDGKEAIEAMRLALEEQEPYELICLDVLMSGINGDEVLMTTSVADAKTIMQSFYDDCDGYIDKPIDHEKLLAINRATRLGGLT